MRANPLRGAFQRGIRQCWDEDGEEFLPLFLAHMDYLHNGNRSAMDEERLASRMPGMAWTAGRILLATRRKIYLKSWLVATREYFLGERFSKETSFLRGGVTYCGDLGQPLPLHMATMGVWCPDLMRVASQRLGDGDVLLDIGAYIGLFSLPLAMRIKGLGVVAVEPNPKSCAFLERNIASNSLGDRFVSLQAAVGAKSGRMELRVPVGHDSGGSISTIPPHQGGGVESIDVDVVSITDVLDRSPGGFPKLIKIDTEGGEPEILETLYPVLGDTRPDLLVELSPEWVDAEQMLSRLEEEGYQIREITRHGLKPLTRKVMSQIDIYCRSV